MHIRARPTTSNARDPEGSLYTSEAPTKTFMYCIVHSMHKHYTHAVKVCIEYLNVLEQDQLPTPENPEGSPCTHQRHKTFIYLFVVVLGTERNEWPKRRGGILKTKSSIVCPIDQLLMPETKRVPDTSEAPTKRSCILCKNTAPML